MSDYSERLAARVLASPSARAAALERLGDQQLRGLILDALERLGHHDRCDLAARAAGYVPRPGRRLTLEFTAPGLAERWILDEIHVDDGVEHWPDPEDLARREAYVAALNAHGMHIGTPVEPGLADRIAAAQQESAVADMQRALRRSGHGLDP